MATAVELKYLAGQIKQKFKNDPELKYRVNTVLARTFLLTVPTIAVDRVGYTTATKSIGAGVHELYLIKEEG